MSASIPVLQAVTRSGASRRALVLTPVAARVLLVTLALAGTGAGFLATSHQAAWAATADAGRELTHLLRAMAVMKTMFAAGAAAVTYWRLGSPVAWPRFALYAAAIMSMAAGPGLIWDMAHVKLGALLLHGGLLASVLLLWRDPAIAERLSARWARQRNVPQT